MAGAAMMDAKTHEKLCPRCGTATTRSALRCEGCGWEYPPLLVEGRIGTIPTVEAAAPRLAPVPSPAPAPLPFTQAYTGSLDRPAIALLLGGAGIVISVMPLVGLPLSVGAVVTAARVLSTAGKRQGVAVAGLVCGIVGVVLGLILVGLLVRQAMMPPAPGVRWQR